jgi:DNA-binding transcriptional MocR family regulator
MTADGPDMDMVEKLVAIDPSIKGIWCVPKYSNPEGVVYSDETVRRFAALKPAADDFRIFWDNAYAVHDLVDDAPEILDIFEEAAKFGNEDMIFEFASTSKITFPGNGIAMLIASENNVNQIKPLLGVQTIGSDKMNQLRHLAFLPDKAAVASHMKKQAEHLSKRFAVVLDTLVRDLGGTGIAAWTEPRGGYFVSLDVLPHTAKRVYELMKDAGVTLTAVGATYPYGIDPEDKNLRIAPSNVKLDDITIIAKYVVICSKIAALEKVLDI